MTKEVINKFFGIRRKGAIMAISLVVALLLSACKDKAPAVKPSGNVNSTQSTSSNDSSTEVSSVDPLDGTITFEQTVSNTKENTEILPKGNTANLNKPLKGYADNKAEKLRQEILNTGNTEEYYKITGTKYYVSSINGDDLNSGTSPDKAFKSIEGLATIELKSGDAVLFESGSVFRLYTTFLTSKGVTYGSYGTGEKPKIFGSAVNLTSVVWTPSVKKNVWQIDYVYAECAGMFFNHGKEIGYKRVGLRNLKKNTDFYQDPATDILYLYSDKGNPSKVYESIEFSTQMNIIGIPSGVDNVTIDNLCIKYGGIMGVSGTWNTDHINVTNCEIGYIGGGTTSNGTSRYGNAIQFWTGANDIVCDHNWIYQTWDTAISWQGYGGKEFTYTNISFSDNLLEYNNGDFEYWDDGSLIKDFTMARNIMRFTSLGWGTREDDGGYRGIDGSFVGNTKRMKVDNIQIKDNIIDCPGRYIINWVIEPTRLDKEIFISGTEIYVNPSYRTTDIILRGFVSNDAQDDSVSTDKAQIFEETLKRFDKNAILKWH